MSFGPSIKRKVVEYVSKCRWCGDRIDIGAESVCLDRIHVHERTRKMNFHLECFKGMSDKVFPKTADNIKEKS